MPAAATPPLTEEYTMPRTEALLAATMALMTGHAQSGSDTAINREALAHKIGANLAALSGDPLLSPGFQCLLWALRSRWHAAQSSLLGATSRGDEGHNLWHHCPEAVQ